MTWYFLIVAVLVLGAVAAVAAGRGGSMAEAERISPMRLPEERLTATDVRQVRFRSGFRGYRMDEVDELLNRIVAQMATAEPDQPWRRPDGASGA